MKFLISILLALTSILTNAQCVTYKISSKGDTLNCVDKKNLKQGKWLIHVDELRSNPGYEEEGEFKNGKKEGIWRIYSLMGDLIGFENYKWGFKNGISQYFTMAGIEREESWRAVDPEKPYDTVDVPDVYNPLKVDRKVIKIEGTSVKHGIWKYYRTGTSTIIKTETYFLDKLQKPAVEDYTSFEKKPAAPTGKPKEVIEFEKKVESKKGKKIRMGTTGY
jgi:hypothetical protein